MSALKLVLLSVATSSIAFTLLDTHSVPSTQLGGKLGAEAQAIVCGQGASSLASDPFFEFSPQIAANITTYLAVALCLLLASIVLRNAKGTSVLRTIAFSILAVSAISYLRHTREPQIKETCISATTRIKDLFQRDASDIFAVAFNPLDHIPETLPVFKENHDIQMTYKIGLLPHIDEYFITLQPYLVFVYAAIGLALFIRPVKDIFWGNYFTISALVGVGLMVMSFWNETPNTFDRTEPIEILVLRAVIFVLLTLGLLGFVALFSKIVAHRLTVISLVFIIMRAHLTGVPYFGLHVEIPVVIVLMTLLYNGCDTSNGAILLWIVAGYLLKLPILDWALVVRLVDNLLLTVVRATRKQPAHGKKRKVE